MTYSSPKPPAELAAQSEALFIQSFQPSGVLGHTVDVHRALRPDADDAAFVLQTFDKGQLFVVDGDAAAQRHAQTGIFAVDELRDFAVMSGTAVAAVAGADDHVPLMALFDGTHDGDAVDDAAVEHRDTVDVNCLADIRQTAAGVDDVYRTAGVGKFREIFGVAGQTVCRDDLERAGIGKISLIVERHKLIGETLVEQFRVVDATMGDELPHTKIIIFDEHVNIRDARTPRLAADI